MSESTLAELIEEFDLRRRLDATRQGELEETTRVLLEVRQRHPGLELAFRVEEAMRFTRDTWSIDDQEGAGRPALSARLVPLLESSSSDEATAALCEEGRKHASAELPSRLEAIEAFERAATPKIRMWLSILRAAALARGPVTFRERCVRGDGRLAWCASASVRAMILFALGEAQAALALWHPDVDGVLSREPARRVVPAGPFRTSGRDPNEGSPDTAERRGQPATLEPAALRSRVERAVRAALLADTSTIADAFRSVDAKARETERWAIHRLVFGELTAAAEAAPRSSAVLAPIRCASLVLDSLVRLSHLRVDSLDTEIRRVSGNLQELAALMSSHYRLRGPPRTLVAESSAGVAAHGFSDQMPALVAALSKEMAATRERAGWDRPAPWCDDYVLAEACTDDPSRSWSARLPFITDRAGREREKQRRALAARLETVGLPAPTERDSVQARAITRALGAHPIAAVFYGIPSIQTLLRSLRVESGDGFSSRVAGVRETSPVLEQWAGRAVQAFGGLATPGQVVELCVEHHLFGSALLDPEPPMFDREV